MNKQTTMNKIIINLTNLHISINGHAHCYSTYESFN